MKPEKSFGAKETRFLPPIVKFKNACDMAQLLLLPSPFAVVRILPNSLYLIGNLNNLA